jgi:long-chain acyl-CoA synthetase
VKQIEMHPLWRRKVFHWGVDVGKSYSRARREGGAGALLALQRKLADQFVFSKIKSRTGGRIRFFVSGGAPLSPELGEFFDAVGLPIIEGYGLSETSPVISVNALEDFKFGTVGRPIPGVEVKLAEDGEIVVRGPNIMKGYWNDPASTAEALDHEGWLRTGDIGELDEEGFLRITDRKKHLLVSSGGKNIAPQPIEHLFLQSLFIDQFVLIGDRRMYCTALIVPDFDALKARKLTAEPARGGNDGVVDAPDVVKFFEEEVEKIQRELPNYEKVRKFTLLREPFTVEGGTLTPTLKIKRKAVEERCKSIIDKMYEGRN